MNIRPWTMFSGTLYFTSRDVDAITNQEMLQTTGKCLNRLQKKIKKIEKTKELKFREF